MQNHKIDVLNDIMGWADSMSMERIKRKKGPPPSMEQETTPTDAEASPADLAEMKPKEEDELSLEDLMNLEKEYK
jgi:flagellar motor switch/type III secretory pathway protein FliN